jgi:glycopeptide antibiotics resistance protein
VDQLIGNGWRAIGVLLVAALPAMAVWAVLTASRARRLDRMTAMRSSALDVGVGWSLVVIAVVGLRPGFGETPDWGQWNLVPFVDLLRSLRQADWVREIAIANLVGNVLFFVPWGIAAGLRFPTMRWWLLIAATAALSLAVEIGQAVEASGRISDVTDVLMNTLGGAIGFGLVRLAQLLQRRRVAARRAATRTAPPGR